MGYALVLVLAIAAGVGVYFATMRFSRIEEVRPSDGPGGSGGQTAAGSEWSAAPVRSASGGVVLAPGRRSWQTRAVGAMGLVLLVSLTAVGLGLLVFFGGSVIGRILSDAAQSGGVSPGP